MPDCEVVRSREVGERGMGKRAGEAGEAGGAGEEELLISVQYPIPNSLYPIPNAQCPIPCPISKKIK